MKYMFFLLAFIFGYQVTSAQTHAEKKFIRFAIGKGDLWYNQKIRAYDINEVREALSKDTLFDWRYTARYEHHLLPDSLAFFLTKAEHAVISKQLDEMKGFIFKKDIFKNSLAVIFENMAASKKVHYGKLDFNPDDYKNGGYAFTKPIFIRNKTVGFIYITHRGNANVMMYVKERNEWKVKYMLTLAIFD